MLVEGAPGLAKTKAIKELAEGIEAQFHRIQFTPDLLPADITGTEIYTLSLHDALPICCRRSTDTVCGLPAYSKSPHAPVGAGLPAMASTRSGKIGRAHV